MTRIVINAAVPGKRRLIVDWAFHTPEWNQPVRYTSGRIGESESYAHPRYFTHQIDWCDVMYFRGGDTFKLIASLQTAGEWQKAIKNKIICAFSAGVSALSKHSINQDRYVMVHGSGVLPFNTLVHYEPHKEWMVNWLRHDFPDIPVMTITDDAYMEVVV